MKREPNSKNRITKTRKFPWKTIKKLESNKEIDENSKRNYKETIQQKEMKFTRIEGRRQHMAKG